MRYVLIHLIVIGFSVLAAHAQDINFDSLTQVLEKVGFNDQHYRSKWDSVQNKFGYNSPEFITLLKKINTQDSINYLIVSEILDRYGWLGPAETSNDANGALFYVIQHATLEKQLKYLPMMEAAVARKKARPADLALLIDRTNMYQGKFQIYGSQMNMDAGGNVHIYPIANEPAVEYRRKQMGLMPMQEYLKHIKDGFVYNVPKRDLYKNKFVVKGSVIKTGSNEPIEGVSVYLANNKLIATSGPGGFFEVLLNPKLRNTALIFRKEGYESVSMPIEGLVKVVIDINPSMKLL
ncbi:MAG: DUF6624 domain-containing protein [Chryseolinea sp.]